MMHWPVMKLAASDASRTAAPFNSPVWPKRFIGVRIRQLFAAVGGVEMVIFPKILALGGAANYREAASKGRLPPELAALQATLH